MWLLIAFTVWPLASFFMRIGLYPGVTFWFQASVTAVFVVPLCIYCFLHHYTNQRGTFLLSIFYIGTIIMVLTNLFGAYLINPQIAIAVLGERAGSGSSMGWVAKDVLDQYFDMGEKGDVESFENLLG